MTTKSYTLLCEVLIKNKIFITHLNLDGNLIGDKIVSDLCEMIHRLRSIYALNLSKCEITDAGAEEIATIFNRSYLKVRSVILHWNKIRGKGSVALCKGIKRTKYL